VSVLAAERRPPGYLAPLPADVVRAARTRTLPTNGWRCARHLLSRHGLAIFGR